MNTNQELRKLAEAATPGPWSAFICAGKTLAVDVGPVATGTRPCVVMWTGLDDTGFNFKQNKANTKYLAAANPAKVIELLDRIDRLEAENERLKIIADTDKASADKWRAENEAKDRLLGRVANRLDIDNDKGDYRLYIAITQHLKGTP